MLSSIMLRRWEIGLLLDSGRSHVQGDPKTYFLTLSDSLSQCGHGQGNTKA